jgi:hypothetical protein
MEKSWSACSEFVSIPEIVSFPNLTDLVGMERIPRGLDILGVAPEASLYMCKWDSLSMVICYTPAIIPPFMLVGFISCPHHPRSCLGPHWHLGRQLWHAPVLGVVCLEFLHLTTCIGG